MVRAPGRCGCLTVDKVRLLAQHTRFESPPLPAPRLTDSSLIKNTQRAGLLRELNVTIEYQAQCGTKQVIHFSKATNVNILKDPTNQKFVLHPPL